MLKFEVLNTAFKGKQFKFKEGLLVGGGANCQIRAQHAEMQDVHARFYADGHKKMVEIGCKEAHLYVNGRDVVRHELRHGDELVIGPLRFRVVDEARISQVTKLDQLIESLDKVEDSEVYDFAKEDLFYRTTKEPSLRQNIAFVIPSKDRYIDQAQSFLSRLVKGCGMEEEKVDAFMTCLKELILNAHRHGHKFDETKQIIVRYRDLGDRLSVSITDQGTGFDHKSMLAAVKAKNAAQAARERYQAGGVGGLGFQLIAKMADELMYNEVGNQVTFVVKKKSAEE
jgi:anti-sigma regulatory factor (Ser/Thr protein kinase)